MIDPRRRLLAPTQTLGALALSLLLVPPAAAGPGATLSLHPAPRAAGLATLDAPESGGQAEDVRLQVSLGGQPLMTLQGPLARRVQGAPVSLSGQRYTPEVWRPALPEASAGLVPPATATFPRRLVVVAPLDYVQQSRDLRRYLDWKEASGWAVTLATEADWDHPGAPDGDDLPARLREWLRGEHARAGGGFLLLIGDPRPDGNLPMRLTNPALRLVTYMPADLRASLVDVPTDAYFGELESEWDCDGDGVFAEYPGDAGEGCVDWGPEFVVGRLPIYNQSWASADLLLRRAVAWDQAESTAYRGRALAAGAYAGFAGQPSVTGWGSYDENDDLGVFLAATATDLGELYGLTTLRLFEDEGIVTSGYPHEGPVSLDSLVEHWRQGYGTVSWGGHGLDTGVYRLIWHEDGDSNGRADGWGEVSSRALLETSQLRRLADAPPAFVHAMSCLNGAPDTPGNLGTSLLYKGAIVTATASRSTIGVSGADWQPMPELGSATTHSYYFNLLLRAGLSGGEAIAFTRYGLPANGWDVYRGGRSSDNAIGWLVKLQYNLYGDPTLGLGPCAVDAECDDGLPCNGVERCDEGSCVRSAWLDCSALDGPCSHGVCDNELGRCVERPLPDGQLCDDGLWCSVADRCAAGQCLGEPRCDSLGEDLSCDEAARGCLAAAGPEQDDAGIDDDASPQPSDGASDGGGCALAGAPPWAAPGLGSLLLGARR